MSRPTRSSRQRDAEAEEQPQQGPIRRGFTAWGPPPGGQILEDDTETESEYLPVIGLDEMDEDDDDHYETLDEDEEEEDDDDDEDEIINGYLEEEDENEDGDASEHDLEALAQILQEEIASGGVETTATDTTDDGGGGGRAADDDGVIDASVMFSQQRLLRLLGLVGLRNVRIMNTDTGRPQARARVVSSEESDIPATTRFRRRPVSSKRLAGRKPSLAGRALIDSSAFGHTERKQGRIYRAKKQAHRLLERELGAVCYGKEKATTPFIKHDMIPEDTPDMILHYRSRVYSGQFSHDGNFFFSCSQDMRVRMYDTSNPCQWKYYKTVIMPYGQWTITDATLTADNKWLAYSSMSHIVCLASTDPMSDAEPRALDLSRSLGGGSSRMRSAARWFSAFSVRFSGDGRELVAGTGDNCVYVFDIERDSTVLRIPNHEDDVNAVCFGDINSPHILYSGSDDCTVKVWDRRSMGDGRAAGVFLGHTEGVTYVDSAGDGRYVVSNGKDQTCKLWDLRRVISTEKAVKVNTYQYSQGWDYRGGGYDVGQWRAHPNDCSLVTFEGHEVSKTLIRCHFSPLGSTDKRYVYSGSANGKVYIWNMDATLHSTIDVASGTQHLRDRDATEFDYHWGSRGGYGTVIRDVSWHPHVPMVAATAWNGWSTGMGTCTVHSWNDGLAADDSFVPLGRFYDEQLHPYADASAAANGVASDSDSDDDDDSDSDSHSNYEDQGTAHAPRARTRAQRQRLLQTHGGRRQRAV